MENQAAEIWQHVHERLRAFIAQRVGNASETDDLLQEVFKRVHRHIDELREPDRLVSWVFQITRHVLIDYYRTPGRRREVPSGSAEELEAIHSGPHEEPEAGRELSGCLRPMIERLGLSVRGMKPRVQRGRKQLKMLLEECCVIELDGRNDVIDFEHRRPDSPSC